MGTAVWEMSRPAAAPANPLEKAHFTRVTDFESVEAAISPDGRFVAFVSDHDGPFDVWLTQVGTGHVTNLTQGKAGPLPGPLRSVGFSGDGSEIWIGGGDVGLRLRLMPLTGGTPRNFLGEETVNLAWSPDGERIVYHTFTNGDPMFVADRTGANARQIFQDRPGMHNHFPIWSPDGRWIYFVAWDTGDGGDGFMAHRPGRQEPGAPHANAIQTSLIPPRSATAQCSTWRGTRTAQDRGCGRLI